MFERKWEQQSDGMKKRLACAMCTPRRVTVSAAYLYQLEQREWLFVQACNTREDAELLTAETERLEGAKAEAERELMYAKNNQRRAEKKATAAVAERDRLQAQVSELKSIVREMRESMAQMTQSARQSEPLRWAVADEKPSRWGYLEVGR